MAQQPKLRYKWIDGLKGLACLGVFTHHFFLLFFPSSFYGPEAATLLNGFDTCLSNTPLGFVINGNFGVNLFVLISSFLPACSIMRCRKEELSEKAGTMILKRYPRLAIPVVSVCMLYYVIIRIMDSVGYSYLGDGIVYGLGDYLLHVFFIQFVIEDITIFGTLWTLPELLFGVFFSVLLSIPSKKENRFMYVVYMFCLMACRAVNVNFSAVIFGVVLADMVCFDRLGEIKKQFSITAGRRFEVTLSIVLMILGLYFGGYPSYAAPAGVYGLVIPVAAISTYVMIHAAGAFLLMGGIFLFHRHIDGSFLSSKVCLFLGHCCMGIYLLHPILINFVGYPLSNTLILKTGNRNFAVFIVYIVVLALIISGSWLFNIIIEKNGEKICSRIKA